MQRKKEQMLRAASIPLVTHDPFFSIWSSTDCLYDSDTVHWSGIPQRMNGYLVADGKAYSFMGKRIPYAMLTQVSLRVTAMATEYVFENEKVSLTLRFTSPLLLDDKVLVSRPCTYVDFEVEKKDAQDVSLHFEISADLVRTGRDMVLSHNNVWKNKDVSYSYITMGRAKQEPLGASGDKVTIDWGYAYLATDRKDAELSYEPSLERMTMCVELEKRKEEIHTILAYDDLLSVNYFGQWRRAYWTRVYPTIFDAIGAAFADREEVQRRAAEFDQALEQRARAWGGEDYAYLCSMSYRQAVSAHKLVTDENGQILFLSKENDSNGCIGTVDVSYPSIPLFLLYDTEYVKGMLRPIFKFADMDVWNYDFAPHDVGRYPYAWGQAYGVKTRIVGMRLEEAVPAVHPPYFLYPASCDMYQFEQQMPVEECGNMLIMCAAVCIQEDSAEFIKPYWDTLKRWREYLLKYGADPGEQLCTDDFAGHLAHNTNLSIKAIVGIEAYARLAELKGDSKEAEKYHRVAKNMAMDWEMCAASGDHYRLTFDQPESWSLKYNLIWDKLWGSGLFSREVYETELACYERKMACYGMPLDSRSSQTKSDWQLWCAAMSKDRTQAERMIAPVARYLRETETRVPFSDWYDVKTGRSYGFIARSVQGGIFMPMLCQKYRKEQ